jgi:uncharacterized membrane protein YgcG
MATAKKKAPAKQAAPAKRAAPAKKVVNKKPKTDVSEFENEYFIRQGKAYVRLASSGDVMGPYSLNSAAGKTALGNQGGGGARGARGNSGSGGGMRGGGGAMLGRGK